MPIEYMRPAVPSNPRNAGTSAGSLSPSSGGGTSSVKLHGRPARKSRAAWPFVVIARRGRPSPRYESATKFLWNAMPSIASPRTPCNRAGLRASVNGVPTGVRRAPGATRSPSSVPYGEPTAIVTPSPSRYGGLCARMSITSISKLGLTALW